MEQGFTEVADVEEIHANSEGGNVLTHDENQSQEALSDSAVILLSLLDPNPKVKIYSMEQACARYTACGVPEFTKQKAWWRKRFEGAAMLFMPW